MLRASIHSSRRQQMQTMQNTSTGSLDDSQLQTRAFYFVIATANRILTPVCHSVASSLFFPHDVAPVSIWIRLTRRHAPWASLPLLARVAAPPARSSARCKATCPYVGLSPQPTLDAARERLRQGEVRGGGLEGS